MGKRKSYYHKKGESQSEKKAKLKFGESFNKLDIDMKGFLITYNCKFTFCLNEAKKLLQQFSLPSEIDSDKNENGNKCDDLEKELQNELDSLNKRDKEFAILDTGAKYTIFINIDSVDPNKVVEAIFEHMEKTKKPLGRYIMRLLPIMNTCKAHLEDIQKCMVKTLDQSEVIRNCLSELGENAKAFKYCCVFKTSNNSSIKREDVFRIVGTYFHEKNQANKVDFDAPEYVLIIQIICKMCFVSLVKNYFEYKKYNFVEQGSKFTTLNNVPEIKKKPDNIEIKNETIEAESTVCKPFSLVQEQESVVKPHDEEILNNEKDEKIDASKTEELKEN